MSRQYPSQPGEYLRDKLSKERKADTLKDIIKTAEQQPQDENNIHAETSHKKQAHHVPVIETANPIVKATTHSDTCSETMTI